MRPLALKGHGRPITRVRLNNEGDILFSSAKDKHICVWYTENGERIGTYEGHNGAVFDIDVSWDTNTLVSAAGDQKMMVWICLIHQLLHGDCLGLGRPDWQNAR